MMITVIQVLWLLFVLAEALELKDEEYYAMPRLFELDDYDECLGGSGAFCVGSFHLTSKRYSRLLDTIKNYSSDKKHFNHSVIHRGYCVTTTCAHIQGATVPRVYEECVQNITKTKYGLDARLLNFEYCRVDDTQPDIDTVDIIYASIVGLLVIANVTGSAYDFFRKPNIKPNRFLMPWSVFVNWNRLTASTEKVNHRSNGGDLDSVNGMKSAVLIGAVLVHSILAHHMTYILNPAFIEKANVQPLTTLLNNGTVVIQTSIILSSFLVAYNLLSYTEADPKKKIGLVFWWKTLLSRIIRITPLSMLVVGFSATWWRYMSEGPLWSSLVEAERTRCRNKWWAHALYVNNLVMTDERCLVQTWFLAMDMQLYLLTSVLLVLLVKRQRTAVKVLPALFVISMLLNFFISYNWDLKTFLFIAHPEFFRQLQYIEAPSFQWQYEAPWCNAPAAILGLYLAFMYHLMRKSKYNLPKAATFRTFYRLSIPAMVLWVYAGNLVKDSQSNLVVAIYTTLSRPVFAILASTAIIGFFYKVDSLWWKILSWRGWQILGRMSFSILMVHWTYNVTLLAVRTNLVRISVFDIVSHTLMSLFLTYFTSVPLYLFVERPTYKFLQTLLI